MLVDRLFRYINTLKWHSIYFLSPHVYTIGNVAHEMYYATIKAQRENRKLVLLFVFDLPFLTRYRYANRALFQLQSDYIVKLPRYAEWLSEIMLTVIYLPSRLVVLLLRKWLGIRLPESYSYPRIGTNEICVPPHVENEFIWKAVRKLNWSHYYRQERPVWLSRNEMMHCGELLSQMGPSTSEWFVCLHVRESGYREDTGRREHRNSDVYNYIPAIEFITNQGGWVIRTGDSSMKPLPEMSRVVDYPFSRFRSEMMDIYLVLQCRFYIATQTGTYDVARMAKKKILLTNMVTWLSGWPCHAYERGIFKHVYSNLDNRFLSISELLGGESEHREFALTGINGTADETLFPDSQSYSYRENSPDEIKDAVAEYYDMVDSDKWVKTDIQKKADALRFKQARELLKNGGVALQDRITAGFASTDEEEIIERYLVAAHAHYLGTLCHGFLKKNWIQDSLNKPY